MGINKKVKITGGAGFLGTALVERLLKEGATVSVMSRNEKSQHELRSKFPQVDCVIGDVADKHSVMQFVEGADIVIHAAAIKHIPVAEKQPRVACLTNILGSMNVIEACERFEVEQCIGISTDKAADPFNTYGMTKYLMERLFIEANNSHKASTRKIAYKLVRYGNVFASSGSVIPFWMREKKGGRRLKVTDPEMTRFFFSVTEAVDLIFKVLNSGVGGFVYSKKMNSARLGDVADVIAGDGGYDIIGNRGGEKLHEALFSKSESEDVIYKMVDGEELLMLVPGFSSDIEIAQYTSDSVRRITKEEIKKMINDAGYEI